MHFCIDPIYDSNGIWQASTKDLLSKNLRKHIEARSSNIHHYAFFTGKDSAGASGIAFLGTGCFHFWTGKFL